MFKSSAKEPHVTDKRLRVREGHRLTPAHTVDGWENLTPDSQFSGLWVNELSLPALSLLAEKQQPGCRAKPTVKPLQGPRALPLSGWVDRPKHSVIRGLVAYQIFVLSRQPWQSAGGSSRRGWAIQKAGGTSYLSLAQLFGGPDTRWLSQPCLWCSTWGGGWGVATPECAPILFPDLRDRRQIERKTKK